MIYRQSDPSKVWTRSQDQQQRAIFNNVLVEFCLGEEDGQGTFKGGSAPISCGIEYDQC